MQKSLTIIIIKKFINELLKFLCLLQYVAVSLWPRISSSHTQPHKSCKCVMCQVKP
jgi:hypothetical protein